MELGKSVRMGHPGLVGLPLVLTVVFCFALVMTHPHDRPADARSAPAQKVSDESETSLHSKPKPKKKLSSNYHSKISSSAKVVTGPSSVSRISVTTGSGTTPSVTGNPQQSGAALQQASQDTTPFKKVLRKTINRTTDTLQSMTNSLPH